MENITDTTEKVFKLTDEPISRELKSVLENLAAGRKVLREHILKNLREKVLQILQMMAQYVTITL